MAYTADINIVVKGQGAVSALQKSLTEVGEKIDEIAKKRFGPVTNLDTFNEQLSEAKRRLSEVVAGTTNETEAIRNYVTALGNANAAVDRQNKLIQNEIDLREAATKGVRELADLQQYLYEKQRQLENSKLDEQAARVQAELDKQATAAAESAAQITRLNERQSEFIERTNAAAQAAARQTSEFYRQARIAKEVAKLNENTPAAQLLLPAAAPGAPAMSGGARRRITGPVERLGGARTEDEAAMALRFAQALKEQIRPLSQIQALYAGIAQQAAQMQRIKALPDSAMLNAAGRGLHQLETAQDSYNRELQESAERLLQIDRLEASRQRRAKKLQDIADYYGSPSAMANAGFGVQGPAVPPGGVRRGGAATGGGGRTQMQMFENLALGAGFPLLFGGGPGQVLGGLLGSFVGTGFGGQILGSALGGQLEQLGVAATKAGAALQKPIDNFTTIEERAILASSSQERYVKNLIEAGQYIEATAAVQKRYNEIVGKQGSEDLVQLARTSDELSRTWGELNLQLQAALAGPLAGVLEWVNNILRVNITQPAQNAARMEAFMKQLTPEQQKEYFRRSVELRKQNKGVVDPNAVRRLQEEMLPGGIPGFTPAQADTQFKAVETQLLASLERRKEIQSQINRLRESEISAGQKQLQNELTLLNTQKQFALSLNQESAIINQIASKKVAAANAEYALTQRQQQALIINAQLELNVAEAKAKAAAEEMRQLDAANKLTPLRQAELQAVMENVVVARNNLEITKGIADNVTRSAAAQAQHTAQMAELERRQAQVNAYAEEYARINERTTRQLEEQTNALSNRASLTAAISQAVQTINNLEIEGLTRELERTSSTERRAQIIDRIYKLEIENARVALESTRAQINAELARAEAAYRTVQLKYEELRAVVQLAEAEGVANRAHYAALEAQGSALRIAKDNLATAGQIAQWQWKAADAVFKAAVDAAKLKKEMGGAASAAGQFAGNMERAAAASQKVSGIGQKTTGTPFAAYGGAMAIEDPILRKVAMAIWEREAANAARMGRSGASIGVAGLPNAEREIAKIALAERKMREERQKIAEQQQLRDLVASGELDKYPYEIARQIRSLIDTSVASELSKTNDTGYVRLPGVGLPKPTAPASPTPIPTTAPVAMGLSRQPGGGPGMAIIDSFPKVPTTINLQTGPVLQQEDGKKYVSLSDLEKILQDFAAVVFNNARTAGGRQYQGVS